VRYVEVLTGEASFDVRKDDGRPFDVRSGVALVRDVSTRFDVRKKRESTIVTVVEGRVKIAAPGAAGRVGGDPWAAAPEFHALQQVELDEVTGALRVLPDLSERQLTQLQLWEKGRIDLEGLTLGEALEEFSRYQAGVTFKFAESSIRDLRVFGGQIEANQLDAFLLWLDLRRQIHHTISRSSDGTTVVTFYRKRKVTTHASAPGSGAAPTDPRFPDRSQPGLHH
jgi:transmembrane sensor